MTTPIVWSYSGAKTFENCPRQYNEVKRLNKYPPQDTQATLYGKEVHKALEDFLIEGKPVPDQFKRFAKYGEMVANIKGERFIEHKMGFTEDLKPCGFDDPGVWWHGIPDVLIVDGERAWLLDWKTGKSARYADTGQLELLAVATMLHHPQVKKVKAALVFLVADNLIEKTYTREQIPEIISVWYGKINQIEAAIESDVWNERPGPLCKFCVVTECLHNR